LQQRLAIRIGIFLLDRSLFGLKSLSNPGPQVALPLFEESIDRVGDILGPVLGILGDFRGNVRGCGRGLRSFRRQALAGPAHCILGFGFHRIDVLLGSLGIQFDGPLVLLNRIDFGIRPIGLLVRWAF
jgi:hypothetical protein